MRASEAQRARTCTLRPLAKGLVLMKAAGNLRAGPVSNGPRDQDYNSLVTVNSIWRRLVAHGGDKEESACDSATHIYESGWPLELQLLEATVAWTPGFQGSSNQAESQNSKYQRRSMHK